MNWFLYDNGLRHERVKRNLEMISQPAITCSELTTETLEHSVNFEYINTLF